MMAVDTTTIFLIGLTAVAGVVTVIAYIMDRRKR